jgi:hypothetical protein
MTRNLITLGLLIAGPLLSQSITITSPTAASSQSGYITLASTLSSLPSVASVEYFVNGDSQGIAWAAPWTLPNWNTNNIYNSGSAWHWIYAVARNSLGAEIARTCGSIGTTCTQGNSIAFEVSNSYREAPSVITMSSVTTSTPINSPWSGVQTLTLNIGGTSASHAKRYVVTVDGDYHTNFGAINQGCTACALTLNTSAYPNGNHLVAAVVRNENTSDDPCTNCASFPFTIWQQQIDFENGTAAMELQVSPKEWVIAPTAMQSLTARLVNTDLTTGSPASLNYALVLSSSNSAANLAEKIIAGTIVGETTSWTFTNSPWHSPSIATFKPAMSATIAPVNSTSGSTSSGSSIAATAFSVTTGNFVVCQVAWNGGPTVTGVTDNASPPNVFTGLHLTNIGSGEVNSQLWYAKNVTGNASDVITASLSGGVTNILGIACIQYSGVDTSSPADVDDTSGTGGSNGNSTTTAAITTSTANELIIVAQGLDRASTAALASTGYSSGNTGVCTVNSSTGVVTGVAFGTCPITFAAGSLSRTIYGYVASLPNVIPHWGTDGTIHTTEDGDSLFFADIFNGTGNASGFTDNSKSLAQYGTPYTQAGFNTYEKDLCLASGNCWGNSQSNFNTLVSSYVSTLAPILNFGLYFHGIGTSLLSTNASSCGTNTSCWYQGTAAAGSSQSYSPVGSTAYAQALVNTGKLIGMEAPDEADGHFHYPIAVGQIGQTNGPSQIACGSGSSPTCTVTWPAGGVDYSGNTHLIITGATTNSVLNTTLGGATYAMGSITGTSFTFTGPSGAANATANSASDPSMVLEVLFVQWENSTSYSHVGDYANFVNGIRAASTPVPFTGPVRALQSDPISQYGWMGNPASSDYSVVYTNNGWQYSSHPQHGLLADWRTAAATQTEYNIRTFWGNMRAPRAWMLLTNGLPLDYGLEGQGLSITSITGPTITFSAPHGVYNTYPDVSRATISGTSNSYFNANSGSVYITACPTATTCNIALNTPSSSAVSTPNYGTITFANGNTQTGVKMNSNGGFTFSGGCTNQMAANRGQSFTWAGSGADPYWTTNTFYYVGYPAVTGNTFYCQDFWREVPPAAQTATGGAAVVNPDNGYRRGTNYNYYEANYGPRQAAAGVILCAVLGCTGHRQYLQGADEALLQVEGGTGAPAFGDTSGGDIQVGTSPYYTNVETGAVTQFWAAANPNKLFQRLAAGGYLYNPRLGCPDIAYNIECSIRSGAKGNLLLAVNLQDGPQTRTVDLTNCAVSGQKTLRYMVDWKHIDITEIAAGTTSDSAPFTEGGGAVYLCANNEVAEYSPPQISARLADITNATKVVIQWAYLPAPLYRNNLIFPADARSTDCGNMSSPCTLPVDKSIGTIYYRLLYLNSSGAVIATGDVETL